LAEEEEEEESVKKKKKKMRAFYLDSGELVDATTLGKIGVKYWKIADIPGDLPSESGWEQSATLQGIRREQGFKNYDIINVTKASTPPEKLAIFFDEHLHEDEEIRFVLKGAGCFDLRSAEDRWIRIHVVLHDLIIVPAGIYHRFCLDDSGAIQALRLFQDAPKWIAINRSVEADALPAHQEWLASLAANSGAAGPSHQTPGAASSGVNGEGYVLDRAAAAYAHYPHMRRVGDMVYLSGTSSRRPDGTHRGVTLSADGKPTLCIEEQTAGVLENLNNMLQTLGASLAHLVDVTVFLVDMRDYAGMNKIYNQYFEAATGPTRTTVAVHQLPHPNLLIEIKGVAYLRQ
jgi:2-aminomuconate deaminase